MEKKTEDGTTQNQVPAGVTLTPEEIADLKHKAEVSSQNFERAKKAEGEVAELRLKLQESQQANNGQMSDEGKVLLERIGALEGVITSSRQKEIVRDLEAVYPALKDKAADFEKFRNDPANVGMPISTAAKAFLVENDLLEGQPRRGVESPSGGARTPTPLKMTVEEVANLRNTNFRKYSQLVREGKIDLG